MDIDSANKREVVLKIEGDNNSNNSKILRGSSYDFWNDSENRAKMNNNGGIGGDASKSKEKQHQEEDEDMSFEFKQGGEARLEDPPSVLIGQFLHKQKASGEICLDMDLEMDELQHQSGNRNNDNISSKDTVDSSSSRQTLPTVAESPTANQVSFESSIKRRHSNSNNSNSIKDSPAKDSQANDSEGEVVKCSSNKSFNRSPSALKKSSLLTTKTKSRLMDPPPDRTERKSGRAAGRSAQLKSGFLGKNAEDDEDDPLLGDDLPDKYRKERISIWVLIEWISLVVIIAALVCSLTIKYLKGRKLWKLQLWKWEVLILVLICGRLVSSWIVRIIVFFIERNFLLRKRVLYFVYGLRKAVQNCLWLGLVLLAWHYLFDDKVMRATNSNVPKVVTKVLICFLVGVVLWLVKTILVKVLASSFHVSTYFERIQDSLFNQYVIETLSGPPSIELKKLEEDEERTLNEVQKLKNAGAKIPPGLKTTAISPKSGKVIGSEKLQKTPRGEKSPRFSHALSDKDNDGITIDHLHKLNPKNVSAWNMKRLVNTIRHGALTTLDEQIQDSAYDDESSNQIQSEYEAKVAARKIFYNVARPRSKFIYLEDLMRFMSEDEAVKTMSLFEGASENNRINKKALKNWVVNVFRERRALALTLDDTKTAVNTLHRFVNGLVAIIVVVISLLILGIATTKFLLFVSSQVVVVAFVFGNTCKTVFEAIIFLFVMHPFDVGDRCEIDGVQMIVEEMNILTTVFLRYDNQKIIYPNSVLSSKAISNYYRSPDMLDVIEFFIHVSTPTEKIAALKQRIISYIENKKEHWYPAPLFILRDAVDLHMIKIALWPTHTMNHQDMTERFERRSLLLEEMVKVFKELDIQYRLYPVNINVCGMPPANANSERIPLHWAPSSS